MTDYDQEPRDNVPSTGQIPGPTLGMMEREQRRRKNQEKCELKEKDAKTKALETYVSKYAVKDNKGNNKTKWTFEKLEKEVMDASPVTRI